MIDNHQTTNPPSCLYIFLDEGGDFNFSPTGSKYFSLTSVTVVRPFSWDAGIQSLKHDLIETGIDLEYFHASEDRQKVRDQIFDLLNPHLPSIRIDSLLIEKRKTGPALYPPEKFYPRMLGYLIKHIIQNVRLDAATELIVMTDSIPVKTKRDAIEKSVKQTLASVLPPGTKYRVLHHASKSCASLQVADYCNWAVFRKWERGDARSHAKIDQAIRSEFDIFRRGTLLHY